LAECAAVLTLGDELLAAAWCCLPDGNDGTKWRTLRGG
jgi:hypothetical protein